MACQVSESVRHMTSTILITGANRGIGYELARAYAAEGWEVIAANRTSLAPKDFVALAPTCARSATTRPAMPVPRGWRRAWRGGRRTS